MNWSCTLPVAVALASALIIAQRQIVWLLGAYGRVLVIPFLLIVWFGFLSVGQLWGSLAGMAWTATVPLIGIAAVALFRFKRCRLRPLRWTILDRFAFAYLVLLVLAYNGNDNIWHYSIVNTYLRGNIPPCSFNDPATPLRYHSLFDGAAALIAHGFGATPERALDVVTILCVFASMECLQAVSRILFDGRWCHQVARLFFVAGFGPVYLTLLSGNSGADDSFFLHGRTMQTFAASIFRRPIGLGHLIFLFLLAAVLPRFASRRGRAHVARATHFGFLLPCAYVAPQASEELLVFAAILLLMLWLSGKLSWRWLIASIAIVLVSMPMAPLCRAVLYSGGGAALPDLSLSWPATLPRWDPVFLKDGLPLLSAEGLWSCIVELGPIFLGGLMFSARDSRRRAVALIFLLGFLVACSFRYHQSKVYLDRFLFYGTCAGFMLSAIWIEKLEAGSDQRAMPRSIVRAVGVVFVVLPTILGPVGYATRHIVLGVARGFSEPYLPLPTDDLRRLLSSVGPREQVLTDAKYAQGLVLAGFIVAAPVASPESVMVLNDQIPAYWQKHPGLNPQWLLLPAGDPRALGRTKTAEYDGYVLVRTSGRVGG